MCFAISIKVEGELYTYHKVVKAIFKEIEVDALLPQLSNGMLNRAFELQKTIDNLYALINIRQTSDSFIGECKCDDEFRRYISHANIDKRTGLQMLHATESKKSHEMN